jgi:hypothetical protein
MMVDNMISKVMEVSMSMDYVGGKDKIQGNATFITVGNCKHGFLHALSRCIQRKLCAGDGPGG